MSKRVLIPYLGRHARFHDRARMKAGGPLRRLRIPAGVPVPSLPIDWAGSLSFPMDGNDRFGDCMYAAACHGDNTFTGNNGTESSFDLATLERDYLALSGGDNGLDEGMLVSAGKKGLAGNSAACILDALDVDPNDPQAMACAVGYFGGAVFMLDAPDAWINSFHTGSVWDAPAVADQNNGHGTWQNGIDASGRRKTQTWGSYCWMTPAGVALCDPTAFCVFSLRWFNSRGIAPNGKSYDQLAAVWVALGGKPLPPSPFAPVPPPIPVPPMPPMPTPATITLSLTGGTYALTKVA